MSTIAGVAPIAHFLHTLRTGDPRVHGPLTMVPLLDGIHPDPGWLTFEEAAGKLTITEVSEGGQVPMLHLTNDADHPVLLVDGEELVGAKQNRILNTTVLVAARTQATIPVSCVEEGRWAYRTRHFVPGEALYARARAKKAAQVTAALMAGAGHRTDQHALWKDVAERGRELRVASETGAMHDLYGRYRGDIEGARKALAATSDQIGALVWISGRWAGLDILASTRLFARAWRRLCAGYAADALGSTPGEALDPEPGEVMQALLEAATTPAPAVCLGREYRIADARFRGAALVAEERVAHVMAFPATP
ncbi:MAG TPA: DUF6569 family protein [Candidatus Tectomicrobia bacterium]|nr:DUF6569 family protein [Candidatus Tectomicrobia bacterium]